MLKTGKRAMFMITCHYICWMKGRFAECCGGLPRGVFSRLCAGKNKNNI